MSYVNSKPTRIRITISKDVMISYMCINGWEKGKVTRVVFSIQFSSFKYLSKRKGKTRRQGSLAGWN